MLTSWRMVHRPLVLCGALVAFTRCDSAGDRNGRADTTLPPPVGAVESLPSGAPVGRWESSAGIVLLVRDDSLARVIYPTVKQLDSTAVLDEDMVRGFIADAVSADGAAGSARIRGFATLDEECAVWPVVTLASDSLRSWTVAFQRGAAIPIALQLIESLAPADSARLAAQLTRLAASLPNDTSRAFHGLPFTIRGAHRMAEDASESVVAEIVRRLNVEANPREETLLLIAERDRPAGEWRVVYSERASGSELDVQRATALAAVKLAPGGRPTLVIERTGADWITYAFIQRQPDGAWRETWESAYSGC